jgi:hypothetical protein
LDNVLPALCYNLQAHLLKIHCLTFWHLLLWSDGNGFKTSTMRLGADAIVFSRCIKSRYHIISLRFISFCELLFFANWNNGKLLFVLSEPTQSIGLLSYTFLVETGQTDVVVPVVRCVILFF